MSPSPWTPDIAPEIANVLLAEERAMIRRRPDYQNLIKFKNEKSMLHSEVLGFMRYLAAVTEGPIVEFGAYIGGATTMFAKGIVPPRKFISLEPGGAHLTHPQMPSTDIYADLEHNLRDQAIIDRVTLMKMASGEKGAVQKVSDSLQGEKISILSIDSDGHVQRDIELYREFCAPGCILIIDDFLDTGDDEFHKSNYTKRYVMERVASKDLVQFAIYGWGTWFGRFP